MKAYPTEVQQSQCELADIEVKSAHGGTPQRLYEPLSAFANRSKGGVILFGLDESRNFEIVGVGNAHRLQEEISHLVWADMEPQIRPEFTVEIFEGKTVVALEVSPVPADKRPCHYKNAGLQKGSFKGEARTFLHRMRDKRILTQIGYNKGSCYKLPE
jgi:ATP-dependent DNA helicase RecG